MRKIFAVILGLVIIAVGVAYWYWQDNKKGIVKNLIQNTVSDKTDSLYYLRYDSSMIDEVNGKCLLPAIFICSLIPIRRLC
jgi:uncharacterized protein YxeA